MDLNHILNWELKTGSHTFPGPEGGTCINEAAIVAMGMEYKSIVFRDRVSGAFLTHDRETSMRIAETLFGAQVDRLWCEAPADSRCKPPGHWHYRLFCDARGRAVRPRDVAFSRENAGGEWVSWAEFVAGGERSEAA